MRLLSKFFAMGAAAVASASVCVQAKGLDDILVAKYDRKRLFVRARNEGGGFGTDRKKGRAVHQFDAFSNPGHLIHYDNIRTTCPTAQHETYSVSSISRGGSVGETRRISDFRTRFDSIRASLTDGEDKKNFDLRYGHLSTALDHLDHYVAASHKTVTVDWEIGEVKIFGKGSWLELDLNWTEFVYDLTKMDAFLQEAAAFAAERNSSSSPTFRR